MTDTRPFPDALKAVADRVAEAVAAIVPGSAPDMRARIESVVEAALGRLDLVPREEYERELRALTRLENELRRVESRLLAIEAAIEAAQAARGSDAS